MKKTTPTNIYDTNNSPQVQTNSFKLPLLTAKPPVNSLVSCQELWGKLKRVSPRKAFLVCVQHWKRKWMLLMKLYCQGSWPPRANSSVRSYIEPTSSFHTNFTETGPSLLKRQRQSHRQLWDQPSYPEPIPLRAAWVWKWESEDRAQRVRNWKEGRTKYKTLGLKPKKRESEWQSINEWAEVR